MARVETTEVSDSDNEVVSSAKNKSTNGKKVSMAPQDDVSEEQVDDGSDEAQQTAQSMKFSLSFLRSGMVPVSHI